MLSIYDDSGELLTVSEILLTDSLHEFDPIEVCLEAETLDSKLASTYEFVRYDTKLSDKANKIVFLRKELHSIVDKIEKYKEEQSKNKLEQISDYHNLRFSDYKLNDLFSRYFETILQRPEKGRITIDDWNILIRKLELFLDLIKTVDAKGIIEKKQKQRNKFTPLTHLLNESDL